MWKFTLFAWFTIVYAKTNVEKFVGEWYHVGMYTAAPDLITCNKFNITLDGKPCTCDGQSASALKFGVVGIPIIIVEDYNEVPAALQHECKSGNIVKTMAVRLVNDNFFVAYENCYECTEKEPNTANLMAKTLPTKSQLENLQGIEELKGRQGRTCELVK